MNVRCQNKELQREALATSVAQPSRLHVLVTPRFSVAGALDLNGAETGRRGRRRYIRAFTLIELIVVMTLLIVVISFAAPSLAGFFRGRAVEAEARRMLSLSRQGQSRAASEGVPMILWVDIAQRSYGLEADSSYGNGNDDPKAVEYKLDSNVTLEIGASDTTKSSMISGNTLFGSGQSTSQHSSLPQIRFQPDGGIEESSPESFRFADRDGGSLWVAQSRNRLNYEVRTQTEQQNARR